MTRRAAPDDIADHDRELRKHQAPRPLRVLEEDEMANAMLAERAKS